MININESNGRTVMEVVETNRITVVNAGELKTALGEQLRANGRSVLLDLSEIKYMDSTGISVLISALKTSRENGSAFAIRGINPEVGKVLSLMKLDTVFDIED